MSSLATQHCSAKVDRADANTIAACLKELPGWSVSGDVLSRRFDFGNYYETIAFVNLVAWVANRQDHHPDLEVGYNRCKVSYSTHSVGGLSRNDFICAAHIDTALAA